MKLKGIVAAAGIAALLSGGLLTGFANAATPGATVTTSPAVPIATTTEIAPTATTSPQLPIAVTPRTTTSAPGRAPEVSVLPVGAPETGGGGMSDLVSTWG